eukprot:CAMPEP_0201585718 /NCGR_PEP_ID=MMETSP0190_2-20130828/124867_1 /ASSEMBLY_ACC=CAM_ASM_000263 /TAXON_ID=37353 /ORGANISM="Rosalina sp." /LENGTH=30 /DNA_ID= /DNA_START= /DNA_END= /DNA_ORIENTATION=
MMMIYGDGGDGDDGLVLCRQLLLRWVLVLV